MRDWVEQQLKLARVEAQKEGYKEGREEGVKALQDSVVTFLEDYGNVPEEVKERIVVQDDIEILKKWNKISARVESVKEFLEKIDS